MTTKYMAEIKFNTFISKLYIFLIMASFNFGKTLLKLSNYILNT